MSNFITFDRSSIPEPSTYLTEILNKEKSSITKTLSSNFDIEYDNFQSNTPKGIDPKTSKDSNNPPDTINYNSRPTNVRVNEILTDKGDSSNGFYQDTVSDMSSKYNVPKELINSVIKAESNFKKDAESHAGAQGLMQLMPNTAKWLGVKDPFDPKQNIEGGVKYLNYLLNKYDNNLEKSVAAYNAGPGNVDKYGGIPPFKETINYVNKVLNR